MNVYLIILEYSDINVLIPWDWFVKCTREGIDEIVI